MRGCIEESESALRVDPLGYSDPRSPAARSLIGRWGLYSEGFLRAGDRFVDGLTGSPVEDELLYPILSLYRHHIEMELKGRIFDCLNHGLSGLTEEENVSVEEKLTNTHSLTSLWATLKKCHPKCDGECAPTTRGAFERLLTELHNADANSQASRYPVDREGGQTLSRLAFVDPRVLKKGIHKMSKHGVISNCA